MKILGIHYGHDSNVALIENGKILFAISEERINRKKFYWGFPFLSIKAALDYASLSPQDIDKVALVNLHAQQETLGNTLDRFYSRLNENAPWYVNVLKTPLSIFDNLTQLKVRRAIAKKMLLNTVDKLGFDPKKTSFVDHHLAHAAGAYFLSGFKDALVFTSDGKGDLVSHRTYLAKDSILKQLYESLDFDSIGLFYSCVTVFLGFKELRHEGKITGLAAYGDLQKSEHISFPVVVDEHSTVLKNVLISDNEGRNIYRVYLKLLKTHPDLLFRLLSTKSAIMFECARHRFMNFLKNEFAEISRENVAAFAQQCLENVLIELVKEQVQKHKIPNIALSGGTFGNVRLNQKISELDGVESIYIQPAMGDGGLGVGGALWEHWSSQKKWKHSFLPKVYLGPEFSDSQVLKALECSRLSFKKVKNIERHIANALAEGEIVGLFKGRMEWGPRALGNRSILASAEDAGINQILNDRLKRTEFMPFAPIVLEEQASEYFKGYHSDQRAPRFMTVTYDVEENKQSLIPAVVHVDGTARPQVVYKKDNSSLYRILFEYRELKGIPILINTSFNMHEEPIVCTPEDAIRAYQQGAIDILAIENYWVS